MSTAADDGQLCGVPHYDYPESRCTEPASHYRWRVDSHAAPLIIAGRQCGAIAWDEPIRPTGDQP